MEFFGIAMLRHGCQLGSKPPVHLRFLSTQHQTVLSGSATAMRVETELHCPLRCFSSGLGFSLELTTFQGTKACDPIKGISDIKKQP